MHNIFICTCMLSHFSCVRLCDPVDQSPPGSSVHGISQARILGWVAISSSRGSFPPRNQTCISYVSFIGQQVLYYQCDLGNPYVYVCKNIVKYIFKICVLCVYYNLIFLNLPKKNIIIKEKRKAILRAKIFSMLVVKGLLFRIHKLLPQIQRKR